MRPAALCIPLALLVVAVLVGCGSDSNEEPTANSAPEEPGAAAAPAGAAARECQADTAPRGLRVTGVDCETGSAIAAAWSRTPACASPAAASRFSCSIRDYRCLGTVGEGAISVTCARPQRSISFLAEPR